MAEGHRHTEKTPPFVPPARYARRRPTPRLLPCGPTSPERHRHRRCAAASGRTAERYASLGGGVRPAAGGGARAHAPAPAPAGPRGREKRCDPGPPGVYAPNGPTMDTLAHTGPAGDTLARARCRPPRRRRACGAGAPSHFLHGLARDGPSSSAPTGYRADGDQGPTPQPLPHEHCPRPPGRPPGAARVARPARSGCRCAGRSSPPPRARD